MDIPWEFLVLVLVPLVQLPGVLVLSRYVASDDDPAWHPDDGYAYRVDGPVVPGTCPRCGAENDAAYAYCRRCVARLP